MKDWWRFGTRWISGTNTLQLGSNIINGTKKGGTCRIFADCRGLNKQIEKTCWPLINEFFYYLEGNLYSNIDILSGYFRDRARTRKRVKVQQFFITSGPVSREKTPYGTSVRSFSKPNVFNFWWQLLRNGSSLSIWRYGSWKNFRKTSGTVRTGFQIQRLAKTGLKIKGSKHKFFWNIGSFLGTKKKHIVNEISMERSTKQKKELLVYNPTVRKREAKTLLLSIEVHNPLLIS